MKDSGAVVTGQVFDIRRFSTHDGAGIRTTVFLKGCPLHCIWCQNPEGIAPQPQLIYLEKQCIHCGLCTTVCEPGAIRLQNGALVIERQGATDWRQPIDICPSACLMLDSTVYTVEQLMEQVLRDQAFFRHGGGVTLSGGEPLLQSEFAAALLQALHNAGIHTAIETSLYVTPRVLQAILPYIDTIYADFKVFDDSQHRQLTGVSNQLIKENLAALLSSYQKQAVVVRTPLIPQFTALPGNISDIARFISSIYPQVAYELLNYNPLAQAKYSLLGQPYCFTENLPRYSETDMQSFYKLARAAGIQRLIIEG